MKYSLPIRVGFIVCIALYPFVVYLGIQVLPPSYFGLMLLVLLGMRYGVLQPAERSVLLPLLLAFFSYAVVATLAQSRQMLLYYPALVNFSLCGVFLASLRSDEALLLRLVRARGMPISIHGPRYLTRLTAVWAGFFALNGAISLWTTTRSMEVWTSYNGLIAYLLVAVLLGGEWLFRRRYKRRMGTDTR